MPHHGKLAIQFKVLTSPDHDPLGNPRRKTAGGRHHVEVGSTAQLKVLHADPEAKIQWSYSPPKLVNSRTPPTKLVNSRTPPKESSNNQIIEVDGVAFGQIDVTAQDMKSGQTAHLTFFCGSVVIVGADNRYWHMFADGSGGSVNPNHLLQPMIENNVIVADMTGAKEAQQKLKQVAEPEPYVTCYLLNLASFKLDR
ncbi:hypothetical protein [Corallococcus sp. CA041A]|nr:hypothetical protein [Corallococcus sp. CA041A]